MTVWLLLNDDGYVQHVYANKAAASHANHALGNRHEVVAFVRQGAAPDGTLRDEFAMAALTGMAAHPVTGRNDKERLALYAYGIADAMLEERDAQG